MNGVLKDRSLLVLAGILVLAVIVFGYMILEDTTISLNSASGLSLTERQKNKAIDIAINNSYVKNEIESVGRSDFVNYYVKDVKQSQFYEIGPGLNISRVLPVVEIIIGYEEFAGTNAFVYVDLAENRVVHIGYANRADKNGHLPLETYINKTLANTGYSYNQYLSEGQKDEAVRIALEDKRVQDELKDKNYSLNGVFMMSPGSSMGEGDLYVEIYPSVSIMVGRIYEPGYMANVLVDINKGEVVRIDTSVRTPVPRDFLDGE